MASPSSPTDSNPPSAVPLPLPAAAPPSTRRLPPPCWTPEETAALIDAYRDKWYSLGRTNLKATHWQEVADAVNARHGHVTKARRTDVQCKNRIDTLKKKFKIEKARVLESDDYATAWPYFRRLDFLIGGNFPETKPPPPDAGRVSRNAPPVKPPAWAIAPVGPRSGTQKRPPPVTEPAPAISPASMKNSYFHRNFSAFAAVAAAAAEAEAEEESENLKWRSGSERRKRERDWENGYKVVAEAIERFGEIYERVEAEKHKQMVELEKQRMQFAKDLECQRMQLFMETQLQLQKINRSKRSSAAG